MAQCPFTASAQDTDARDAFAKAYALYARGQMAEAKELFAAASDSKFPLSDYSLYYLALIAFQEGQPDESNRLLSKLRQDYPQSIWYYAALLQKAKNDIAQKNYADAADALIALRSGKDVKAEMSQEALYLIAQTHEDRENPASAYAAYRELRDKFPISRWAAAARKEQARLRSKFPELFGFDTLQSLAEEADRLARERAFTEAEVLYKKLINNVTEPELRLAYLDKLASAYLAAGNRDEAIPLFETIAREFPDSSEAAKAVYQIGRILWNHHDNARALAYFQKLLQQYPTSTYADKALYAAGDIREFFGQRDEALDAYNKVIAGFTASPVRADAMWRAAWLHYRAAEWSAASDGFAAVAAQANDPGTRLSALYWQARSGQNGGNYDAAKDLYLQVIKNGPESYYRGLALHSLQRLGVLVEEVKTAAAPAAAEADPPVAPRISFHLTRARELSSISLNRMAVAEIDEAARLKPQPRIRPILMREYYRNHAYARSLALANQLPDSDGERDFYRFPLAFWDMVRQYAEQRGLDPYLVLALIRQESLFDSRAQSPAAALGLMQILPSTAKRIAKQIGMPPPSPESLFQPEVNLALGTKYLQDLLERYANNWFKAIAAYNAGESAVDRWQKEIGTDDVEEFVERIPYGETRGYVKLVIRNHRIYKKLYDGQK